MISFIYTRTRFSIYIGALFLCAALFSGCTSSFRSTAQSPNPLPDKTVLSAFPGAEGFGAETVGGRGGRVIAVTNLNDSGPGSLRAAVNAQGPRIVVFRTGGTITLTRPIRVTSPYLTIAGQTAPGDGIAIRGNEMEIRTHDVIIRNLRWRTGEELDNSPRNPRQAYGCIRVSPGYNVIVDHCSMSWSNDKCATTWTRQTHSITYQWCIMSEPLAHAHPQDAEHARAFLLGDHTRDITLHHNLFAHAQYRMPEVKGDTTSEIINNVCYNWSIAAMLYSDWEASGPIRSNHIANYSIPGPDTPKGNAAHSVQLWAPKGLPTAPAGTQLYISGDVDSFRHEGHGHEWDVVYYGGEDDVKKYLTTSYAITPSGVESGMAVTTQTATKASELVMRHAGAVTPRRDPVDLRIIKDVHARTGRIIGHVNELGSEPYPTLAPGTPPLDTDADGIPDDWEIAHGLNPRDPTDANSIAPSGYTWIEEYINGLIPHP